MCCVTVNQKGDALSDVHAACAKLRASVKIKSLFQKLHDFGGSSAPSPKKRGLTAIQDSGYDL